MPRSLWQVFSQPVTWVCADRLVLLDITERHGAYVPILVKRIASGRFGNLKRLLIDMHWAERDRHIVIPDIEWNIRPLEVLMLSQVPKLELEIFGCLHAKGVGVEGVSEQAMIELVQGGSFKEMKVLRIWQRDWKYMRLEELASACENRNAELLLNKTRRRKDANILTTQNMKPVLLVMRIRIELLRPGSAFPWVIPQQPKEVCKEGSDNRT